MEGHVGQAGVFEEGGCVEAVVVFASRDRWDEAVGFVEPDGVGVYTEFPGDVSCSNVLWGHGS